MNLALITQLTTRRFRKRWLIPSVLVMLAGCSSVSEILEPEKIDYKGAAKTTNKNKLEVPPDLSAPRGNSTYNVDNARGTATASEYSARQPSGTGKQLQQAPRPLRWYQPWYPACG